jgi:hypothetical protein
MCAYEYVTMMIHPVEGVSVVYTYYLVPSGTGTRIFIPLARPTHTDGDPIPSDDLGDMRSMMLGGMQDSFDALFAMTDEYEATAKALAEI